MEELTFEEFCALPMELIMHISGVKEHYLHRANRKAGVSKIVITKVKNEYEFGKPATIYIFDGVTYLTPDQVYLAYMKKACGVTE